jgi:hypothetical protein
MPEVKFLGMCITENLNWQGHICSLCHRLSKTFFIIKPVRNILSSHATWNIYFAYFHSQLRYKAFCIQEKLFRLIERKKNVDTADRNLRKLEFLQ